MNSEQQYNAELITLLAGHFLRRDEPNVAWGSAGGFLDTPGVRGYWRGSSVDNAMNQYDTSGQARTLTAAGLVGTPLPGLYGIAAYADFVRASAQYYGRATEAGLAITEALTMWTWIRFDAPSTGNNVYYFSKYYQVGAPNQHGYLLYKTNANVLGFAISTDGINDVTAVAPAAAYAASVWYFIVGRFTPSTEVALAVGVANTGAFTWYRNVAAIPATIWNSTESLNVGRGSRTNYLDGQMSKWGLAAYALPDVYCWNMFQQTRAMYETT